AHLAVAAEHDRTHVAGGHAVRCDRLVDRRGQVGRRQAQVPLVQRRRAPQPLQVRVQAEHGRALGRRVGADSLEHARAVVQRVRQDVDLGIVPRYETPVTPDLLRRLHWPVLFVRGCGLMLPDAAGCWSQRAVSDTTRTEWIPASPRSRSSTCGSGGVSTESTITASSPRTFRDTFMLAMLAPSSPSSVPTRPIMPGRSSFSITTMCESSSISTW